MPTVSKPPKPFEVSTQKPKRRQILERKLNRLFVGILIAIILLTIIASIALIIPPRPLQQWSSSVLALLTALGTVTSLLSLNQGVNWSNRSGISVYLVAKFIVIVFNVAAVGVLLWGLAANAEQMHLGACFSLFLGLIVLLLLNGANFFLSAQLHRIIPKNQPQKAGNNNNSSSKGIISHRPSSSNGVKTKTAYANPIMETEEKTIFYDRQEQTVSALPNGGSKQHQHRNGSKPSRNGHHKAPNGSANNTLATERNGSITRSHTAAGNGGSATVTTIPHSATNGGAIHHNNNNNVVSDTLASRRSSSSSYAFYQSSAAPRVETLRPAGSEHSVLTMTSDL